MCNTFHNKEVGEQRILKIKERKGGGRKGHKPCLQISQVRAWFLRPLWGRVPFSSDQRQPLMLRSGPSFVPAGGDGGRVERRPAQRRKRCGSPLLSGSDRPQSRRIYERRGFINWSVLLSEYKGSLAKVGVKGRTLKFLIPQAPFQHLLSRWLKNHGIIWCVLTQFITKLLSFHITI